MLSNSKTLVWYALAVPPCALISPATFCAESKLRSSNATFALVFANSFAKNAHKTPPAPVTTMTLSCKL